MTDQQQRMHKVLDETVEYYKTHPRATDGQGDCKYYIKGNMCAVGRCFKNPSKFRNEDIDVDNISKKYDFNAELKEQYQGLLIEFWLRLQDLHDTENYWEKTMYGNDLTPLGFAVADEMHCSIDDGEYTTEL